MTFVHLLCVCECDMYNLVMCCGTCVSLCVRMWTLGWQCGASSPCVCASVRVCTCSTSCLSPPVELTRAVCAVSWWVTTSSLPSAEPTTPPPTHEDTPTLRRRHGPHHTTLPPPYIGHAHTDTPTSSSLYRSTVTLTVAITEQYIAIFVTLCLLLVIMPFLYIIIHCVMFPVNAHCLSWLC